MINVYKHFHKVYYEGFENIAVELDDAANFQIDGWEFFNKKDEDYDPGHKEHKKEIKKAISNFFDQKNGRLLDACLPDEKGIKSSNEFYLKTTYPGLLMGSGYTKGIGAVGEFKLGFHLDYTTGLPIIPGTSVKGALRSVFPKLVRKVKESITYDYGGKSKREIEINKSKLGWIAAQVKSILADSDSFLLKDVDSLNEKESKTFLIKTYKLIKEMFEGESWDKVHAGKKIPVKSIYKRDIFHDAYPLIGSKGGNLLVEDSITPHKKKGKSHEESALTNPVPLLFLKIRPNTIFKFGFDLKDGFWLTAQQKELLFQKILLEWGIGAKTNVGYGQFKHLYFRGDRLTRNRNKTYAQVIKKTDATYKVKLFFKPDIIPEFDLNTHRNLENGEIIRVEIEDFDNRRNFKPRRIRLIQN